MLKCITFDGDPSSLESLMSYFEKFDKALEEMIYKEQTSQPLFVKEGSKIIRICKNEIIYLEGYGDYVRIHLVNGKKLLSQMSLKRFEEVLNEKEFCRVHRSYIIAISRISYIEKKRIRINNELIPIGESYFQQLMSHLSFAL